MASKHKFTHEMGVDFTGTGTTDGGLTFGGTAGFDTGDTEINTGMVFVSGAFGTVTIGDNDAADLLAGGIADVGLNDVGVDDVVEDIRGTTAAQFRYDNSFGSIALAISAGTRTAVAPEFNAVTEDLVRQTGKFGVKKNSYAIGMSFTASGATFGIGYDSDKAISAGLGYSAGPVSANAFWAKRDRTYIHGGISALTTDDDGSFDAGYTGLGVDVSYTTGASTLTFVYARTDLDTVQLYFDGNNPTFSSPSMKGLGVGFSHDLGGGASLVAGFAKVPQRAVGDLGMYELGYVIWDNNGDDDINAEDRVDVGADRNVASAGLSFSF